MKKGNKNNVLKTEVLKRRFKIRKKTEPEKINNPWNGFYSQYAHLSACRFFDSDQFAMYEANFPQFAHDFYTSSGADMYNHDALDLDIAKHVLDEHMHIDEQFESHLAVLDDLHAGVEVEKTSLNAKEEQVKKAIESLLVEHDKLKLRYESFNRKVG